MKPTLTRLTAAGLLALATVGVADAQSSRLRRAERMMEDLNYSQAIEQYTQILESSDDPMAKINLAEAYRKVNDVENAEYWYGQIVRLPESEPVHKLYYGQALQQNGKCDQAKEWYSLYIQEAPDDLRGQYLARACDYEEELRTKNVGVYEVQHLDFNSALDDFGGAVYQNGLVFASDRAQGAAVKRDHAWTGNPFLELYYVETRRTDEEDPLSTVYGRAEKFAADVNSKFHDAAVSFTEDGEQMFFTRNNLLDGKLGRSDDDVIKLKVFYAEKIGENKDGEVKWSDLQSLPFNSDEYSVTHPALSPSGQRLYFASDMPGGFGGMDVYYSEKENGRWGPPINLGPVVNTEGHEAFPYADNTGRIYLASDGHIGLGGFDVYYTMERGPGDFAQPENLGAPVNSVADDHSIYVTQEGDFGYFSSNRNGGAGQDDIYSFTRSGVPVEVLVIDQTTRLPIEGATVLNGCTAATSLTDIDGLAAVDMGEDQTCEFTASAEGYEDVTAEATTVNFTESKLIVEIALGTLREFTIEGFVFDEATGEPLDGAEVTLTSDCDEDDQIVTTDATGRYDFELATGCCYTVRATLENYLTDKQTQICSSDTASTRSFVENLFLAPTQFSGVDGEQLVDGTSVPANQRVVRDDATGTYIDTETGRPAEGLIGRTTYENGQIVDGDGFETGYADNTERGTAIPYLLHIYYDFNKASIREEARADLDKLYTMMEDNPEVIIEIGSHTDARGTDDYNTRLSQRRAEAVVRYLSQRGIARERMVPRGYGESVPVNNCSNNIPCSEREHQFNRRTEFRVLGCTECDEAGKVSTPKEDIEVSRCKGCPF